MSVLESIDDLITDTVTVQRRASGTMVHGTYTAAAPTTFTADIVEMPAFNLNRVVGGVDLHAHVDDQSATEVRQLYTRTKFLTRTPTSDPDVITGFDGADWTVARVEKWVDGETGDTFFHVVVTKVTKGSS